MKDKTLPVTVWTKRAGAAVCSGYSKSGILINRMKHAKKKFRFKVLWILLSILFVLLAAAYGYGAYYFSSHFAFNTTIDKVDCTRMTVDEVEDIIKKQVEGHDMLITGRDSLRIVLTAKDVSLRYVSDGQVDALLKSQNHLLWFVPFFGDGTNATTRVSVNYSSGLLDEKLKSIDLFSEKKMRPPADAFIEFQGSQYIVHPEELGSTLIPNHTEEAIRKAILSLATAVDLDENECYLSPKVFSDDPELVEKVETWNIYVPFAITYIFGEEAELLDGSITMNWIDETGTLNEQAVENWVRDFGKRHDTIGTERSFTTITGEQATVKGGLYGWEVDEEAELDAIWEAYYSHTGEKRKPYYLQEAHVSAPAGQPDWGNAYIELDLTNQHMYYIVDGAIKFEADVVTGAPWGGRTTPPGVYMILDMKSPALLRGEIQTNGKPEYETWVTYWMQWTWLGHGFHDANWQPWFGGDRYTYAGSHGCVNMYYYDAQELYSLVEVGTPVVSHL